MRAVLGKNKPATVLIISSISGLRGNYAAPMYCATKWAVIGFVRSLAEAEKREGVRVMAICPGLVHTHLWTDRPDIMKNLFYAAENALSPTDVAERMIEMCQQKAKYGGGTVFETSVFGSRVIPEWNIDPPNFPLLGTGTGDEVSETYSHIKELLEKERGAALKSSFL
jgi:NAD(P)-dependent dehydrogenase (short-subunit alcohol dehydrogenase family)